MRFRQQIKNSRIFFTLKDYKNQSKGIQEFKTLKPVSVNKSLLVRGILLRYVILVAKSFMTRRDQFQTKNITKKLIWWVNYMVKVEGFSMTLEIIVKYPG